MFALPLLLPVVAQAATLDVCATCAYTTLGQAFHAASTLRSGRSTIRIAAGVYDEDTTLTYRGDVDVVGDGSDVTILRSTADPVFQLGYSKDDGGIDNATVEVSGLTVEERRGMESTPYAPTSN